MNRHIRPIFYGDIAEEVAWLAENAGADIAGRWAAAVWDTIGELSQNPLLGRTRPDIPFPGIRSWRILGFPRWLVFYGLKGDALVFYRVRHGAMNLVRLDFNS